jgi:hypothetical protein
MVPVICVFFYIPYQQYSRSTAGKELSQCQKDIDWTESLFEIIHGAPLLFQSSCCCFLLCFVEMNNN